MLRLCKACQTPFEAQKEQRLCPACFAQAAHSSKMRPRTCKTCGASFIGGSRAWYCPPCRAQRQKQSKQKSRSGKTRAIGSQDVCQNCGKPYFVRGSLQKYCDVCAPQLARQKKNQLSLEWSRAFRKNNPNYKKDLKQNSTVCVICGNPFTASTPANTCSEACRKEQKRRTQRRADAKRGRYKGDPNAPPYNSGLPKSGIVGVTWRDGKWVAKYKNKYLGIFPTIEQAAQAQKNYQDSLACGSQTDK